MKLENQTILIVSNEPWSEIWFSKHNYAYELSKKNTVFFINPSKHWTFSFLFSNKIKKERVSDSLHVITYNNRLPALNFWLIKLNNYFVSLNLRRYFRRNTISDFIFWSFDPCRLYDPKLLGASKSFFHVMDEFIQTHPCEKLLCENVDFVFCVSAALVNAYKKKKKEVFVVPHGISSEEFMDSPLPLETIDIPWKNYGIYVGHIDERIDFDLLELALKKVQGTDFVFIGKHSTVHPLEIEQRIFNSGQYPNVHAIGPRHYKKLKAFIARSSFCMAFMNSVHPGNRISHHKMFQYLALGKPVFCTEFSEYLEVRELFYMEDDPVKLVQMLDHFIKHGEDNALPAKRIAYARQFVFEEIFRKVEHIISNN